TDQPEHGSRLLGHRRLGIVGDRSQGGQGVGGGETTAAEGGAEVAGQRESLGGPERRVALAEQRPELVGGEHPPVVALGGGVEGDPRGTGGAGGGGVGRGPWEEPAAGACAGVGGVDPPRDPPALSGGEGGAGRLLPRRGGGARGSATA